MGVRVFDTPVEYLDLKLLILYVTHFTLISSAVTQLEGTLMREGVSIKAIY